MEYQFESLGPTLPIVVLFALIIFALLALGVVETPNLQKLASNGLSYTRFHTTALCSPTRAALLAPPRPDVTITASGPA